MKCIACIVAFGWNACCGKLFLSHILISCTIPKVHTLTYLWEFWFIVEWNRMFPRCYRAIRPRRYLMYYVDKGSGGVADQYYWDVWEPYFLWRPSRHQIIPLLSYILQGFCGMNLTVDVCSTVEFAFSPLCTQQCSVGHFPIFTLRIIRY